MFEHFGYVIVVGEMHQHMRPIMLGGSDAPTDDKDSACSAMVVLTSPMDRLPLQNLRH